MIKPQEHNPRSPHEIEVVKHVQLAWDLDVWWEVDVELIHGVPYGFVAGGIIDHNEEVGDGLITIRRDGKTLLIADIVWVDETHFQGHAQFWAFPKYGEEPND